MSLPEPLRAVSPLVLAGLILAARTLLVALALPCPSVEAVLEATGASRSRAYEISRAIVALLPTLMAPPGRPPKHPCAPAFDTAAIRRAVLAHVMEHPGCVHRDAERHRYSDGFRHLLIELHDTHPTLELEALAAAALVPLGTLKDWLRTPSTVPNVVAHEPTPAQSRSTANSLHIQTVIDAWPRWSGSFHCFRAQHGRCHPRSSRTATHKSPHTTRTR